MPIPSLYPALPGYTEQVVLGTDADAITINAIVQTSDTQDDAGNLGSMITVEGEITSEVSAYIAAVAGNSEVAIGDFSGFVDGGWHEAGLTGAKRFRITVGISDA